MFLGCYSLREIKCDAIDRSASNCTKSWLAEVGYSGIFYTTTGADWERNSNGVPRTWAIVSDGESEKGQYLVFASQGTTKISLTNYGGNAPKLYYSFDETNWAEWDYSEIEFTREKPLFMYGTDTSFSIDSDKYSTFTASGNDFAINGEISSLISSSDPDIVTEYCFYRLFKECTILEFAPSLPAKIISTACYKEMFYGCYGLRLFPELPATVMAPHCYESMFEGCLHPQNQPVLPALDLANSCYSHMFAGTNLIQAPELPATTLAPSCYSGMFSQCGIDSAPELPATSLEPYCYASMFQFCNHLSSAPALPATTLAEGCYDGMFYYCNLKLQTPPELPATTLKANCYSWMFANCKALTKAPDLIATELVYGCYDKMFSGCESLSYIKCLANNYEGTKNWLDGVASTGTFIKAQNMNDWPRNASGIPEGWTIENE